MPTLSFSAISDFPFTPFDKIFSADMNAMFQTLTTFMNTTKIDSVNIQTGGVITANIADNAITTVKILDGAVTAGKFGSASVATANLIDANVTTAKLADASVTTAKLALLAVDTGNIVAGAVTAAKMASGTITGTQVSSSINLPGNAVQENGKNLVVSSTNASTSLEIIRGYVDGNTGAKAGGEGFTGSVSGGLYTITWSNAFASIPILTATAFGNGSPQVLFVSCQAISTTSAALVAYDVTGTPQLTNIMFTAIGPR